MFYSTSRGSSWVLPSHPPAGLALPMGDDEDRLADYDDGTMYMRACGAHCFTQCCFQKSVARSHSQTECGQMKEQARAPQGCLMHPGCRCSVHQKTVQSTQRVRGCGWVGKMVRSNASLLNQNGHRGEACRTNLNPPTHPMTQMLPLAMLLPHLRCSIQHLGVAVGCCLPTHPPDWLCQWGMMRIDLQTMMMVPCTCVRAVHIVLRNAAFRSLSHGRIRKPNVDR